MDRSYGGLELFLSYVPGSSISILMTTNVLGYPSFAPSSSSDVLGIVSTRIASLVDVDTSDTFFVINTEIDGEIVDSSDYSCNAVSVDLFKIRIFYYNTRISVYINDKWVYSYALATTEYSDENILMLRSVGASINITNIKNVELYDGRDAVFADYEATSDNTIQSIIQQRPIEIYPGVDRNYEFTYDATKEDVDAHNIRQFSKDTKDNSQMSSDGLVYSNDVSISTDLWVARNVGFITRMMRLSELDTGASRAAASLQKRARQSRYQISNSGRLDPRLEVADVQVFDATPVSGTSRTITERAIVEDVQINISDGSYSQSITARSDVDV